MKLPQGWPKHYTPYDPEAPTVLDEAAWEIVEGTFRDQEMTLWMHPDSGLTFIIGTRAWFGEDWRLTAICVNPPRRGVGEMHSRGQEAMRVYLKLTSSTAELEAAEAEAWVASVQGRVH